jgi:chromosome segregation ATPase
MHLRAGNQLPTLRVLPHLHVDCALQERRLLFSQGVTLHVQPDGQAWRQFAMLSGGQQALATLALSFALQVGSS